MTEGPSPADPAIPDPPPAEPAAATPSPQPPVLWPVLRTMLALLRRHWLRIVIFTVVIFLSTAASTAVLVAVPYWCADYRTTSPLLMQYGLLALWAVLQAVWGPLEAGYLFTLYRLLGGETAGARTLVVGYRSRRLFFGLAAGSFVLTASHDALRVLWTYLPWDFCWEYFSNIVTPGSPLDALLGSVPRLGWFISEFHLAVRTLILLPIQWALLEVIVAAKSWPKALAGSAGLAWRNKRLALVFLAAVVALSFDVWLKRLLPSPRAYGEDYGDFVAQVLFCGQLAANVAINLAILAIKAAALVVIYREMRNREAAVQPPESA